MPNKYSLLPPEELKKHLEGFLIDAWSPSCVSDFIGNEKYFEKKHIFRDREKDSSLASIIGKVYHKVLMHFFKLYRDEGTKMNLDDLAFAAHAELGRIGANSYRPQKGKMISDLQNDALKAVNNLIQNFLKEFDSYENEIDTILFVEQKFEEFVTINDIDIPLPLRMIPDVVFVHKDGSLCIFDHKSKKTYTAEKDINLRYSNQSIADKLCLDVAIAKYPDLIKRFPKIKDGVARFYFYENKYTNNRDGSRQIKQIPIDMEKSKNLFEQMLFEGIFRVIEAVQNPDYVYLMNPHDHYQDAGDMVEFWVKTHIEGFEGFPNMKKNARRLLKKRRSAIRRSALTGIPKNMVRSYLNPKAFISYDSKNMENLSIEERIEHRLRTFNFPVKVEHKIAGYSCDTYMVTIGAGLKTSQIYGYRMDIANAIGVKDVRIAPNMMEYEGGVYVAIEVNRNDHKGLMIDKSDIPEGNVFPIGKDNFNNPLTWSIDNPSTPHMMISGASGSGKSVAIQTMIQVALSKGIQVSILDPKHEFIDYRSAGIVVINELEEIEKFMEQKVSEMDAIFRGKGASGNSKQKQLIIFDECADMLMRQSKQRNIMIDKEGNEVTKPDIEMKDAQSEGLSRSEIEELRGLWAVYNTAKKIGDPSFKTLEENTLILAQKARSAGIHLVLAAQRFSVKILTGDAKANFPTRLCLTVSSGIDSKVMLGVEGAEKLNGKGDALFYQPGIGDPVRIQCFSSNNLK
jgi:S-DNA-T family DNA segregation ATPase FtsK/SpoIIIE